MPITVKCDCGKQYNLADSFAGKKIKCRECGEAIRVLPPSTKSKQPELNPRKAAPADENELDFDDLPDAPSPRLLGKKSARKKRPPQEVETSSPRLSQDPLFGTTLVRLQT